MELEVAPYGRTLIVTPGSTILDALLAAGVPFSYSCMAGRCGTCRYKLLEGEVVTESSSGCSTVAPGTFALACGGKPQGNCRIEVAEPDEIVCHPARTVKGVVLSNEPLTSGIRQIRVKLSKPLEFSPGQYVNLQFTPEHVRPYSMADIQAHELEFHVRVVRGGRVSTFIADSVKAGDSVRVSGPLGAAYLRRKHQGPVLFVAGGTGLAPVLAILRGAVAAGMRNPVRVYIGARTIHDVYGLGWLRSLASTHPDMQVHVIVAGDGGHGARRGLITEALAEDLPHLERLGRMDAWRAYLCGSPGLVEASTRSLLMAGMKDEHLHADAFYTSAELAPVAEAA